MTTEANGDRTIGWIRRSRAGFAWIDGTDTALGEEAERYRITVTADGVVARTADVVSPTWTYPAAAFASDTAGTVVSLTIGVAQVSATVGVGLATTCTIDLSR